MKLAETGQGRLYIVIFYLWLIFMALSTIVLLAGGGAWGYLLGTGLIALLVLLIYLIPRVSNWVQYRIWDARLDHYKEN